MIDALTYIYYAYSKFLDLIFNQFQMFSGVYVGWVLISVLVFGILISSILNLPRGVRKRG